MHCDTMGSPFGGYQNGAQFPLLFMPARNIHYLGEAAQLPLPQKRIAKNNRSEGGVCSGGTPYRGVKGRSRWRFLPVASGYGGYVR